MKYAIAAYSTDGLMMTTNKSKELFIGVIDETCLQSDGNHDWVC